VHADLKLTSASPFINKYTVTMGRGGYDTSFDNTGTVAAHLHDHEQKEVRLTSL
jgi:hypothetical protein